MIVDYLRQQILLCILSSLLSYLDAFRPLSLNQIYTMVWKWILQKHLDNLLLLSAKNFFEQLKN